MIDDPDKKYMRETPLTEEQLAAYKAELEAKMIEYGTGTTCERCDLRFKCTLVYDPCNTDGDCLLDK